MQNLKIILACLIVIINLQGLSGQQVKSDQVLFIGNSYTYFWNLPQQVASMAESRGIELKTFQSTIGGANLGQHWKGDRKLKSKLLAETNSYRGIILQDHSMRAIEFPDSLDFYIKNWTELIKENGGQAYLYMTWARKWDPYMIQKISEAYLQIGKEVGAKVVPVGWAWHRAQKLRPDIELYDPDGSHPSPIGTYLTACIFFEALTGENPIGLSNRLISEDHAGEKLYLNFLTPGDALFCQKVAHEIFQVKNYNALIIE
jgi:hypothetical protein